MTQALHAEAYTNLETLEITSRYHEGLQAIADLPGDINIKTPEDASTHEPKTVEHQSEVEKQAQQAKVAFFNAWYHQDESAHSNIYDAVSYLNFIVHLIDEGYLDERQAMRLYMTAYQLCYSKLVDEQVNWWLTGVRQSRPHAFTYFESMCEAIHRDKRLERVLQDKLEQIKLYDRVKHSSKRWCARHASRPKKKQRSVDDLKASTV
jgi:hypothetical protein